EYLAGYAGETVSIRFDPNDITTILVYRQEDKQEVFLTRAHSQGLETERLSLEEAKASSQRIRKAGKALSNESILLEVVERDALVNSSITKKTRKQRQKEEQQLLKPLSEPVMEESFELPISEVMESELGIDLDLDDDFAPIDFDELRGEW
ncbi:MAG: hypothetical protein RLZZ511_2767, partial [Cyanobacteriota bacterium]